MLIADVMRLTAEIRTLRELERTAQHAERFKTRADALSVPAAQLAVLARVLQEFRARGVPVVVDAAQARTLRSFATAVAERYHEEKQSIIGPDATLNAAFWRPLSAYPDRLREALLAAWAAHVTAALPAEQPQVLDTLQAIPSLWPQVNAIRQYYQQAQRLKRTLPSGDADFEEVPRLAAALQQSWLALRGEGVPISAIFDEALAFIRDASTGGATLAQLTPAVRAWLEERGLLETLRIVVPRGAA